MIKNFEFEMNLVMSTLSPDDDDELHLELERLSKSEAELNLEDSVSLSDKSGSSLRKRNLAIADEQEDDDSSSMESCGASDVIRKKRRTTSVADGNRRKTTASLLVGRESDRTLHDAVPPPLVDKDILSEDIEVIFQNESEEISLPADNDVSFAFDKQQPSLRRSTRTNPPPRDHRPLIRHVFQRCFASQSQYSVALGPVLAECSDEE